MSLPFFIFRMLVSREDNSFMTLLVCVYFLLNIFCLRCDIRYFKPLTYFAFCSLSCVVSFFMEFNYFLGVNRRTMSMHDQPSHSFMCTSKIIFNNMSYPLFVAFIGKVLRHGFFKRPPVSLEFGVNIHLC